MAEDNTKMDQLADIPIKADKRRGKFGMFGGVFTPCVLTILGVIMFMRTGFVVGQGGLWLALAILGLSKLITTLTAFSISAIATNTDVKVGGIYYMISRVLGLDFGGAIGITLFLAQAVGVAFYVIGFTEALENVLLPLVGESEMFGSTLAGLWQMLHITQVFSSVLVLGLFALTLKGAGVAVKTQYFVLGALLLSVLSFTLGGILGFRSELAEANRVSSFTEGMSFWPVFAIFFPAVTGVAAGANMSGDLKNPARSIPLGTLLAVGFTALVYGGQIWLMAGNAPASELAADPFGALRRMSVFGPLMVLGVFMATLSSALVSFLGAPRILQSMGQDHLLKIFRFFGKGTGPDREPRRASAATLVIAVAVIWAGDLNAVAVVISMFFLIAYGMINLSAFVESSGANPSFRPRFKWATRSTAMAGTAGCLVAMVKINETAALVSIALTAALWFYLRRKKLSTEWGDARRGYTFSQIRDNLLSLERAPVHPKNWRPILAAVAEEPSRVPQLITVAGLIEGKRGLLSVVDITAAEGRDPLERLELRKARLADLKDYLTSRQIVAFPEAVVGRDSIDALAAFLQSYSIGQLRPNTGLLALPPPEAVEKRELLTSQVRLMRAHGMNLAVLSCGEFIDRKPAERVIDVWWRDEKNGSLMTLFAYLVTLNEKWRGATLRLLRIVPAADIETEMRGKLKALVRRARLAMDIEVIVSAGPSHGVITKMSAGSDMVFIGMSEHDALDFKAYAEKIDGLLAGLPATVIVLSNGKANLFA